MPKNTHVDRAYQALRRKGASKSKAARVAQAANRAIAQDRQAAKEGAHTMSIFNARGEPRMACCGARTRSGAPCRNLSVRGDDGLPRNGRCRMHSGNGTGPRAVTARQLANLRNHKPCPPRSAAL